MNFKPELLAKVLAGEKTVTRRIKKPREIMVCESMVISTWADGPVLHDRAKWIVGNDYAAAPGRGKHGVGRIKLLSIDDECVSDISEEDAIAEGFTSRAEFFEAWDRINGKNKRNVWVWVLRFELVKATQPALLEAVTP